MRSVVPEPRGGFRLETSDGELLAGTVVLCTGAYQRPHRPPIAGALPEGVALARHRRLHRAGRPPARPGARGRQRPVGLPDRGGAAAVRPRGLPRVRAGGVVDPADRRPRPDLVGRTRRATSTSRSARSRAPRRGSTRNVVATGHGGGHDLHLRTLHALGVQPARPPRRRRRPPCAVRRRPHGDGGVGRCRAAPTCSGSCATSSPTAACPSPTCPSPSRCASTRSSSSTSAASAR